MVDKFATSKAIAAAFAVMTVSAIAGTIAMITLFEIQSSGINMTAVPTEPITTLAPPPVMRLPESLVPEAYELYLWPHLYTKIIEKVNVTSPNQTMLLTGNSTVHFQCVQATRSIFLHSKDLTILASKVMEKDKKKEIPSLKPIHHTDGSDFMEIPLDDNLKKGEKYSLFLSFEGEISQNLQALFVSTYDEGEPEDEDDESTKRFLAATNLQPTDARKLFPCFDEPDMKAEFLVTIIHRRHTTALGNTHKTSDVLDDDWTCTKFSETPVMSTYLLAFMVSDLECQIPTDGKISMCARPEAIAAGHTKYANKVTLDILRHYELYFDMPFAPDKLDQVALPDLGPAAMENWGLITYQEGGLLYEEGVSSVLHKDTIASLIAHELAHQWFGNLVTMKWWNEIWLNEGFATYMSYAAVDKVEPSFQMKDASIMTDLQAVFEADALASSHPLSPPENDIQGADEINGMFDEISYSKGAMVLRMLATYMGEQTFMNGVKAYLKTYKFENTIQDDLWHHLQLAYGRRDVNVTKVMRSWTDQAGYPVVTINTTSGSFVQKRFLFNSINDANQQWYIPIKTMSNRSNVIDNLLKPGDSGRKDEFISRNGEWILANVNCTGYFRVNYNIENWKRLLTQLEENPHRIPVINRGQLIDDAFNLARAKLVNVTLALNLTRFLSKETALIPWDSAFRNLEYFVHMFDRSEVYGPMQAYLQKQVTELYLSFQNETENPEVTSSHSSKYNQIKAISVACSNGLPECIEMVKSKYDEWMAINGTNNIDTTLRSVIYCQAVAAGGKKEWEFAWEKFLSSKDISEKNQLRYALSCTKKIWLLNRYLEYTLDSEKIRLMDVVPTINNIAMNSAGQALAWNFIRAHWDYVGQVDGALLIEGVTSRFSTQFELDELIRFSNDDEQSSVKWALNQAIEQTRVNIQWVREHKDVILEWFEGEMETAERE
ncbi:alanyl (membrane) aminopeptidase-like b isoform X1 [Embiotoca jacksoni]|uniref:alanyl (membrane) aminopeptidase-like b isoform X1 n=1 Tax=Embiotoca jacksoni TaxID=100190 RepID=UPI0037037A27